MQDVLLAAHVRVCPAAVVNRMIAIAEMESMLDELAAELPGELYKELNGGIILLSEAKLHRDSVDHDLYVLGEYHHHSDIGRYIAIYYGSFIKAHGHLPADKMKEKLRHTLHHEFTHHLESLAGERDLEIEDERSIARYLKRHGRIR